MLTAELEALPKLRPTTDGPLSDFAGMLLGNLH